MRLTKIIKNFISKIFVARNSQQLMTWSREQLCKAYDPTITLKNSNGGTNLLTRVVQSLKIIGRDPVNGKNREVSIIFYAARGKVIPRAAVIIQSSMESLSTLDRTYATELCSAGIAVVLITRREGTDETNLDFSKHDRESLRTLVATRHVVEFLSIHGYGSIGIFGTGLGSIDSALAFAIDSRILTAAFVTGSGRVADVLAESDDPAIKKLRVARMVHFKIPSLAEYKERLRNEIHIEPLSFLKAHTQDPRSALFISADLDTTLPTLYQIELADALSARHIQLSGNHQDILKVTVIHYRNEITKFFLDNLAL